MIDSSRNNIDNTNNWKAHYDESE